MKKKLAWILTAVMTLSVVPVYAGVPASPTASKVAVNGESKAFEAYNINDNNYFKLRDIAYVLNGTDASFSVGWDGAANSIALEKGKAYAPTGSELKVSGTKDIKDAVESTSAILIDGEKASLKAYTIKGNNYFKLRDLGTSLGFNVGWDNVSQTISITTEPSTTVKPKAETKTALTWEEAEEMGLYVEIISIYPEQGFFIEAIGLANTSTISEVSAKSVTVNGTNATTDVYIGTYVADQIGYPEAANFDFYLQYNFPRNILYMNQNEEDPDYGKPNNVSITYELQTNDGKLYTCKVDYNLLCAGNGGIWIE